MNIAETGQSFIEGLALIASPCILPVLPLVLSGGIEGGKARPFGITAGFVAAFSVFVLASRQLVSLLHIDPNILRNVSLALLFLLGVTMFSEKLSGWFSRATQKFADVGSSAGGGPNGGQGFWGGMATGALIGLVWTPCAGPVLAAVLVQVIRQKTDLQSVTVTAAFALGAALPMLAITLAGKKLVTRLGFLKQHSEAVRKIFAVLILLATAFIAFGSSATQLFATGGEQQTQSSGTLQHGVDAPYPAPDFTGIKDWLNSPPLTMQQLRGKVVLVDFWTYSCINCVRTLPYITAWDAKYRDKGLVIVGVHSPEFEFEKDTGNIKTAIEKYGIKYPVAVDSDLATWDAFHNQYWPAHYLIDKDGRVVYTHFGEGNYDQTENNIRYLLGISGDVDASSGTNPVTAPRLLNETPETYLGYHRADRFSGTAQRDRFAAYKPANSVPENYFTLGGSWKIAGKKITAGDGASLQLNFKAKKVFLVMGTSDGKPRSVTLKLNGAPLAANQMGKDAPGGAVAITGHALYELIDQPSPDKGLLQIDAPAGVELYAFTFGE